MHKSCVWDFWGFLIEDHESQGSGWVKGARMRVAYMNRVGGILGLCPNPLQKWSYEKCWCWCKNCFNASIIFHYTHYLWTFRPLMCGFQKCFAPNGCIFYFTIHELSEISSYKPLPLQPKRNGKSTWGYDTWTPNKDIIMGKTELYLQERWWNWNKQNPPHW